MDARSLDYLVVGVNEFYTSKRCPKCRKSGTEPKDFIGSITIRQLYCEVCRTYFHRDEMAASNMVNAICVQLQQNKRPNYLLPINESKKFVKKRQSPSDITTRDQHTSAGKQKVTHGRESLPKPRPAVAMKTASARKQKLLPTLSRSVTGKRKAEPETRTSRKKRQTWEPESDAESDSSWQPREEDGEEEEEEGSLASEEGEEEKE
ncbi:hypothetical protein BGX27_002585 [Mortierella sp. AM989]|nr:hypothetical protein BGX27_002585 [Mortierella sp. AM989]